MVRDETAKIQHLLERFAVQLDGVLADEAEHARRLPVAEARKLLLQAYDLVEKARQKLDAVGPETRKLAAWPG